MTADPQGEKKSLPKLLWGMLIRPRATLTYLKEHQQRTWWFVAVLGLALTVLPLLATRSISSGTSLPGEMPPATINGGGSSIVVEPGVMPEGTPETPNAPPAPGVLNFVGRVLGTLVTWLGWGVALYVASVFLGRSSTFQQMLRLTVWTWLPYAVRSLVQFLYILATRERIVNAGLSGFAVNKNAPALLPPGPGQLALSSILSRVDIYLIWNLALLTLGLVAFTNLPRKKALTAVLVIWAVLALVGIVPTLIGGMAGQMTPTG